jgi:hypothetical protein
MDKGIYEVFSSSDLRVEKRIITREEDEARGRGILKASAGLTGSDDFEGLKGLEIQHQAGTILIRSGQDHQSLLLWHCHPLTCPNCRAGTPGRFIGSYDIHLARKAGYWKIDTFSCQSTLVEGNLTPGS